MKNKNRKLFIILIGIFFIIIFLIRFNITYAYKNTTNVILLSKYIITNTELVTQKDGLEKENNTYIFKGEITNNYVLYNNIIWRIIKINNDNTIELIMDDYINMLPKSLISNFINNLKNNLDLNYLNKNIICKDQLNNENNITCQNLEEDDYVSLLTVYDYMNSFYNNKTYITSDNEIMWLYNDKAHTNGDNLSISDKNNFYEIRPIITIKSDILYKAGNGTKNSPYQIGNNDFSLGTKVKINNDNYIVYDYQEDIKLMSLKSIKQIYKGNILNFLNNKLFSKLEYKEILKDTTIYNGKFINDENDILKTSIRKKIGIPSILDIKFNSNIKDYYLSNKVNNFDLVYSNPIIYGDSNTIHETRYTITLNKNEITNFIKENNIYVYKKGEKWKK